MTPAIHGECKPGTGTDYQVGDGQSLTSLDDVPRNTPGPGDTVRIHHRTEPYHNKIFLSTRGAEGNPIKVCGVPSATGELPVLDAAGATTSPHQIWSPWTELQDYGVLLVATGGGQPFDFRPGHIEIANLEIRGAKPGNTYTTSTGETRSFTDRGTGIYIVNGDYLELLRFVRAIDDDVWPTVVDICFRDAARRDAFVELFDESLSREQFAESVRRALATWEGPIWRTKPAAKKRRAPAKKKSP